MRDKRQFRRFRTFQGKEDKAMEKSPIKIIKKAKRECPEVRSEPGFLVDANKWSKAVRTWVAEFKSTAHRESAPTFDRLFQPSEQQVS